MKNVSIYSTPSCMYCRAAKDFFKGKKIKYTDYDVSTDAQRREEMIQKSGQMGVPVIFVDDEMVIGFDKERLSRALGV